MDKMPSKSHQSPISPILGADHSSSDEPGALVVLVRTINVQVLVSTDPYVSMTLIVTEIDPVDDGAIPYTQPDEAFRYHQEGPLAIDQI